MKPNRTSILLSPGRQGHRAGSALLLALACVALLTVLVVAFLFAASNEFSTSTYYARSVNTKLLSDTAVNTVIAQISQATKSTDALSTGTVVAWASQPGMIRTYDTSGNAVSNYKLYSWDNMAAPANTFVQASEVAPTGWDTQKGIWTDLNEPVQTSANGPVYPILQGSNPVAGISLQSGLTDIYGNAVPGKSYHLATDTGSAGSLADVEGFNVNTPPAQTGSSPVNPDVPMPVKWMYVLQDGTTVVAQPSTNGSATAASVPGASATNKIVGRIAFWTDDETSKVNINTASEGNFWDVPLADGVEERSLAINIPVEGEYQRIAGHPATVSLSSVFGAHNQFFPSTWSAPNQTSFTLPGDSTVLADLYNLTPRMMWGGTQFGSAPYTLTPETSSSPAYFNYVGNSIPSSIVLPAPAALGTKANRLYSTIDELLFDPTNPNPARNPNAIMTPAALDQAKFFITANSRAPEVTLFNTPRVSIWPITWPNTGIVNGGGTTTTVANANKLNPLAGNLYYANTSPPMLMPEEKLLAFCGTVGGDPYYFQRQNAYDSVWDYNNISRNQDLIKYLDTMTTQAVPGFGGNFGTKYGNDQPQIITEIFDYIRSGPDLNNSVAGTLGSSGQLAINYNYAPIGSRDFSFSANNGSIYNGGSSLNGGASVIPITITHGGATTQGTGRFATITEAALVFYAADRKYAQPGLTNSADASNWEFIGPHVSTDSKSGSQTTQLGMFVLLNVYNPMTGYLTNTPYFIVEMTGSTPFQINGANTTFPQGPSFASNSRTLMNFNSVGGGAISSTDSMMGCIWTLAGLRGYGKVFNTNAYPGTGSPIYPFFITPVIVSPTVNTFTFTGSPVTLKIWSVDPRNVPLPITTNGPIQTISMDFSKLNGTYPMPVAPEYNIRWTSSDNSLPVPSAANVPNAVKASLLSLSSNVASDFPQECYDYNIGPYYFSPGPLPANAVPTLTKPAPGGIYNPLPSTSYNDSGFAGLPSAPWNNSFDMRNLWGRSQITAGNGTYNTLFAPNTPSINTPVVEAYNSFVKNGVKTFCDADTVISLRLNPAGVPQGDARLLAMTQNVPSSWFIAHYALSTVAGQTFPVKGAHSLAFGQNEWPSYSGFAGSGVGYNYLENMFGYLPPPQPSPTSPQPGYFSLFRNGMGNPTAWVGQNTTPIPGLNTTLSPITGDFANGIGGFTDGAVIPKPDDTTSALGADPGHPATLVTPYFSGYNGVQSSAPYFSPARQMSGPVIFGTLPTGIQAQVPWRTLAFNPNPITGPTHIGLQSPPDHLLLDLFWMPVVEPYAISEPLSTAGKINMNYQIEPFTYINRQTALYAAMKSDKILVIPSAASSVYKNPDQNSGGPGPGTPNSVPNTWGFHFPVDIFHTLQQFDSMFTSGKIFVSASQICSIFLDPRANPLYSPPAPFALPTPDSVGSTTNIKAWWAANNPNTSLTGVNGRQQPYAHLYSLLTTKSNTFQVHMRVQVVTKSNRTDPAIFDEAAGDVVTGEYRGSAIIERYVDANDTTLPDFAGYTNNPSQAFTQAGSNTLDPYYRFRIVSTKAFTPK